MIDKQNRFLSRKKNQRDTNIHKNHIVNKISDKTVTDEMWSYYASFFCSAVATCCAMKIFALYGAHLQQERP